MVRKSTEPNRGNRKLHFKNKHDGFKGGKQKSARVNKSKQNKTKRFHNTKEKDIPGKFKKDIKPRPEVLKEELSSSDSELDAFSQLVSCFSDSSKKHSVLSDDDSDTDDGEDSNEKYNVSMDVWDKDDTSNDENIKSNSVHSVIIDDDSDHVSLSSASEGDELLKVDRSSIGLRDPFENHIHYDLSDNLYDAVSSMPPTTEESTKIWPILGHLKTSIPNPSNFTSQAKKSLRIDNDIEYANPGEIPHRIEKMSGADWERHFVKSQIQGNILSANSKHTGQLLSEEDQLTPLQKELFSVINNYQDFYYPERTHQNGEELRFVYCLHAINHVLKTRLKVVHHNARLANMEDLKGAVPEEFRDQGLVRPKVLILVPFRNSALRVVEVLSSILLEKENNNVLNKKRFYDEFTAREIAMPHKNPKPEDYERTFAGDTDDNFKLGISVTKKSLKLYADFYSADIIVASPLGLRMIVGAEGQADRDFDFLASIELLVLDQAEIIYMQNWDHLLHIWDHLHMQPRESHGTNFARVRPWALSGRTRFYRQTLLFCAHALPQISALYSRRCHNYAGRVSVVNPIKTGTICQIVLQLPQVFNRLECSSAIDSIDARFNHFVSKVLPQFKEPMMSHTLIYVPSYFDYVRIRNHFKKETISFVQICEYSKDGKIARARDMFFHSSAHFLLYSERFHFFRRIRLKGIRHIVFYQPPTIPHFYSELCNLMQSDKQTDEGSLSVSVLYTRYDVVQLAAIVGSERAARMLRSDRSVHMFMTGD